MTDTKLNKDGLVPGALVSQADHLRVASKKRQESAKKARAKAELEAKKAAKKQ
jgi:hypothetical protein